MILDLDFGNSAGKWRVIHENKNFAGGRFDYSNLQSFFALIPRNIERIRAVSVLSVEKQASIAQLIEKEFSLAIEFASVAKSIAGVANGYQKYQQLGADRWLVIVAAWHKVKNLCLVIDAGSAITIDCIDRDGIHLGGYIMPGLAMMRNALISGTGRIQVDREEIALEPGIDTAQAVGHGSLLAAVSAINAVEEMLVSRFGVAPKILITGGDAKYLLPFVVKPAVEMPDLVFEGLQIVLP